MGFERKGVILQARLIGQKMFFIACFEDRILLMLMCHGLGLSETRHAESSGNVFLLIEIFLCYPAGLLA